MKIRTEEEKHQYEEVEKTSKIFPSLLTKSEMEWLLGNSVSITKSYKYKMKSSIRKKWRNFINLELPLLQKSGIISDNLTALGKDLTTYGKVENQIISSISLDCGQNMVGQKGPIWNFRWVAIRISSHTIR